MTFETEKRLIQIVIAVLAAVPVLTGLAGVLLGPEFLGVSTPWPVDLDSHFRFLSGIFVVIGIGWYSCIPAIERQTGRLRALALMTFAGGLSRLISLGLMGAPSAGHRYGLFAELALVPLIVLWQNRLRRLRG